MAPQLETPATPTGPVIPLSTATEAPSAASVLPSPPTPTPDPVSYYDTSSTDTSALAGATSRMHPSSLSTTSARTLGAVLGSVIGVALLALALTSWFLCCRKRRRAAGAGVYRNSSFLAGPQYPAMGMNGGVDSAATSKEAFAHYHARTRSTDTRGELRMSDLELVHGMPQRPPSVVTYDGAAPGTPVAYAQSERSGPTVPWQVVVKARDVKAVKAGSPVKAVIAPVLTSSPEAIRPPPSAHKAQHLRYYQTQQQQHRDLPDDSPDSSSSSHGSRSPSPRSASSSPETRQSHGTVLTPPTSPTSGPGAHKTAQGDRPKLRIVTAMVGDNEVPQVAIEPLRFAQPGPGGKRPEYARLLFAGDMGSGMSSTSIATATTTGAVEDVFSPACSPLQAEYSSEVKQAVTPPAIVITSPQMEWEGDEGEYSPNSHEELLEDEGYGSDEQDQGDYSDRDEEEEFGDIDDEVLEDEELTFGHYSPTEERMSPARAITLDLHMPLTMSPTQPPLPSGFPSSVTLPSNQSQVSVYPSSVHTASPTQNLPMTFASRRELTTPIGFPQSPCESEVDFDDMYPPQADSDGEGAETDGLEGVGFSPVLNHPAMQPSGKNGASFRVWEMDQRAPSPVPPKRPQTAEERLKGLGIGNVRLPTITVTEWAEEGLMRF